MRPALCLLLVAALLSLAQRAAAQVQSSFAGFEPHRAAAQPSPMATLHRGASAVDAYGRPLYDVGAISYRWWLERGRAGLAFGIGAVGYLVATPEPYPPGPFAMTQGASLVSVSWRYAASDRSTWYADASSARHAGPDHFNARVGVEWKARSSALGFDHGALGVRLDSGYRMSLRPRRGGLAIYLRGQF